MKYQPYPQYKDSGVEWIGEIPQGWEAKRLKYLFDVEMGQSPSSDDVNLNGVGLPFLQGCSDFSDAHPEPRNWCLVAKKVAESGDILFSVRAPVGEMNVADQQYGIGRGLCAIRAQGSRYAWYSLIVMKRQLDLALTGSTFEAVATDDVRSVVVALPGPTSQIAIAAFLDRETVKIDALVHDYEDLIALLTEKRQALISHAVTRGLSELVDTNDPEFGEWCKPVRFRDSGVEWLGEIPEGWKVKRLKHISVSWCDGPFGSGMKSEHYSESGVRVIRLQNIGNDRFEGADIVYVENSHAEGLGDHSVVAGDLLVAGLGDDNHPTGRAVVAPIDIAPAMVKADCFRFRLNGKISPDFLAYQLQSTASAFSRLASTGTTRERVNLSSMAQRQIAVAVKEEQSAIASFLTRETTKIDTLVRETQDAIGLLKEHRSALITAAVTGKINVEES